MNRHRAPGMTGEAITTKTFSDSFSRGGDFLEKPSQPVTRHSTDTLGATAPRGYFRSRQVPPLPCPAARPGPPRARTRPPARMGAGASYAPHASWRREFPLILPPSHNRGRKARAGQRFPRYPNGYATRRASFLALAVAPRPLASPSTAGRAPGGGSAGELRRRRRPRVMSGTGAGLKWHIRSPEKWPGASCLGDSWGRSHG